MALYSSDRCDEALCPKTATGERRGDLTLRAARFPEAGADVETTEEC